MSEQDNLNPAPPRPTIKTSAVPLKKETVRITLRPLAPQALEAPPEPAAPAAPAAPPRPSVATVPVAIAPPPRPSMAPPAPAVASAPPPRPAVAPPVAAGAPPSPGVNRPAPPASPIGSKTIPLSQPPARPAAPVVNKPTTRLAGAPATQALPKATVKLSAAPAPSAPVSSVALRSAVVEDDEEINEGPLNAMGWISLLASAAALVIALSCFMKNDTFVAGDVDDTPAAKESWRKDSGETSGIQLPTDYSPFDRKDGKGGIISEYATLEPAVPARPEEPK